MPFFNIFACFLFCFWNVRKFNCQGRFVSKQITIRACVFLEKITVRAVFWGPSKGPSEYPLRHYQKNSPSFNLNKAHLLIHHCEFGEHERRKIRNGVRKTSRKDFSSPMLQEGSGRFQEGAPEGMLHKFHLKHKKTQRDNKKLKAKQRKKKRKQRRTENGH